MICSQRVGSSSALHLWSMTQDGSKELDYILWCCSIVQDIANDKMSK